MAAVDDPVTREGAKLSGIRTVLYVALRKDDALLGQIVAGRREVRPFSEKEIALVENFAAQAVIAMENARLITETREALEQQTATAEVLQVINSSPGDLAPVFDAMLERAMRLCEASFGMMHTFDGAKLHPVSHQGLPPLFAQFAINLANQPGPGGATPRLIRDLRLRFVHVIDLKEEEAYRAGDPYRRALVDVGGARTLLAIPLRRDDAMVGVINIYRQEVHPYTFKQIALMENFAAQAVIAMENARLLTETRETLEQQTATAEVLQVINSSPGDLTPVFDAMLDKAVRLCEAAFGVLHIYDGERFHPVSTLGVPGAYADYLKRDTPEFGPGTGPARVLAGERVVHIVNMADTEAYRAGEPNRRAIVDLGGARTALGVPLLKDETVLGHFTIYRQQVRPFTDKQIALLQNFAAQAVIAMENARLLTETRESLEQQTATAEVLQVINSSPGDLAPVFQAILQKAHTLCEASFGALMTYDGERFHPVAHQGTPVPFREFLAPGIRPGESDPFARMVERAALSHIQDLSDVADRYRDEPLPRAAVDLGGVRTFLVVPLRKDDALLGVITAYRQEVRPFTDKQIALLQNFAAQAVIAMENARLLTETREALEQQTATAEVLQVINSSPGDLAPVFDAIVEKATRLCGAAFGHQHMFDGEFFRIVAAHGDHRFVRRIQDVGGIRANDTITFERILGGESVVHIADVSEDVAYRLGKSGAIDAVKVGGMRTLATVALRKDEKLLGTISIYRREVRPFNDKQIALLQNFAAQAVIAMENARLLTETREALEQQTATAEVLQVINSLPGDLAPVFDAMLDKAMRLCEAAFGFLSTYDGEYFHAVALRGVPQKFAEGWLSAPYRSGPNTTHDRLIRGERLVHVPDLAADGVRDTRRRAVLEVGWHTVGIGCAAAQGRRAARCDPHLSPGGAAVYRQTNRARGKFRGSSGHRDGECAAAGRDPPASAGIAGHL